MINKKTIPPAVKSFQTWLYKQQHRDDAVGTLARHAANHGTLGWPAVRYDPDHAPRSSALARHLEARGDTELAQAAKEAEMEWVERKQANKETETAVHEAGHAVVAAILGRPIEQVDIIPNDKVLGTCSYKDGFGPLDAQRIERDLIITYAGTAAAEVYAGPLHPPIRIGWGDGSYASHLLEAWTDIVGYDLPERFSHWTGDYEPTIEEIEDLCEFESLRSGNYADVLTRRTKRLLRENWAKVEAVAAALLENRRLRGEQVLRIVESVQEQPPVVTCKYTQLAFSFS
jgi:hypothetical protein